MIGSGFSTMPELATPFPSGRKFWTSPSGILVPKEYNANMEWREDVLRKAEHDLVLQQDLLYECAESCIFWINLFMYTRHEFEVATDNRSGKRPSTVAHWPMITWEVQDALFLWLEEHFNDGEDGLIDKSRDMGASWCGLGFNHWLWLFRKVSTQIREMSRSEVYVDSASTKSLFYKHDYINTWLPAWMRPPGVLVRGKENRTSLWIHNALNDNTIVGESTTKHALSADRCSLLFLDEFSKVEHGEMIKTASYAAAACRIVNSTVAGPGTAYSIWKNSGQIDVFPMMFWDHPEKGAKRFVIQDDITKLYKISSPWLECVKKSCSAKEIAQEQYAIDAEAGDTFFDIHEIDVHSALFARPPITEHSISLKTSIPDEDISRLLQKRDMSAYIVKIAPNGKLKVWVDLINGRPEQSQTYIFGIDTSKGQGASDSVVSIKSKQTGDKIAQWCCNSTPPHEFSRIIVALALWVGGANPQRLPYLKWEKNGPGWDLGRLLVQVFCYPHYYITKTTGTVIEKVSSNSASGQKYGYHMTREGKEILLREYERALKTGKIHNHDEDALKQAKTYIYNQDGSVGPATLVGATSAEMKQHGDKVIADALTVEDEDVSSPKAKKFIVPAGCFADRCNKYKKKRKRDKKNRNGWKKSYNFGGG